MIAMSSNIAPIAIHPVTALNDVKVTIVASEAIALSIHIIAFIVASPVLRINRCGSD
jgi:hypothetical protein